MKGLSDIDVVLVLDDATTPSQLEELRSKALLLGRDYGATGMGSGDFEGIPRLMLDESGMFVSPFVCTREDFLSSNFSETFHANPILTRLLVPCNIVWGSILRESKTVYGEDIASRIKTPRVTRADVMKSFLLNELLVLLSLFYSPFTHNATKLALEACKWSVYSTSYLITGRSESIAVSVENLKRSGIAADFLVEFERLRGEYRHSPTFIVSALSGVASVHFGSVAYVKGS